eukprot:TRINITY_DN61061_c0_g1_i1.p1 TRINITY_DN61061_c0_g1~~TRINITY_DN61061_c0_g1_i1.p1  ORF type:complete len:436 (+),score=46.59 TRINITY_DN61061_c0_g1_i1:13-1320(+)
MAFPVFTVQCPQGAGPGTSIQCTSPDGILLEIVVPSGVQPGSCFPVTYGLPTDDHSVIFTEAAQLEDADNRGRGKATAKAEEVHRRLPPSFWGISKNQLKEFIASVSSAIKDSTLVNPSRDELNAAGHPERYYDDAKFRSCEIGPNMHQVNAQFILPETEKPDPLRNIPYLSYSVGKNSQAGLQCDLFYSHAWNEGVFEFWKHALSSWPDDCLGAYICFCANPQHLGDLLSEMIQSPKDSPFYKVLASRPRTMTMIMVPNQNSPIHSRLWCVYEAYCAATLGIRVQVAGDRQALATDKKALAHARRLNVVYRCCRVLCWCSSCISCIFIILVSFGLTYHYVSEANGDNAPEEFDEGVMIPLQIAASIAVVIGVFICCFACRARRSYADMLKDQASALDVRQAECTVPSDAEAIHREIDGFEDKINDMVRSALWQT